MRFLSVGLALLLAVPLDAQEDSADRVATLIRLLGGDDEEISQAAARELLDIGRPARKALREAAKGGDARLRDRIDAIYTFVRWGVHDTCPQAVLDILGRFESADDVEKAEALRELARSAEPAAQEALYAAWWDVDDPDLLAELATPSKPDRPVMREQVVVLDADEIERRLASATPVDHPAVLCARAEARLRGGDDGAACDLFARLPSPGTEALESWGRALFGTRRYGEAADVLARAKEAGLHTTLLRAECLYRAGRRGEAEGVLAGLSPMELDDQQAAGWELALTNGSARFVVEHSPPPYIAARAWILLGEPDRAEESWRGIQEQDKRRRVLALLLEARGEGSLLTPAFTMESMAPRTEDAQRHARLAARVEGSAPATALREWQKARLLDPSTAGCQDAIERLRAHAAETAGCRSYEVASPPSHLLFASEPVLLGDFYYYMNEEGTLLKVRDPLHPVPEWSYSPPPVRQAQYRGIVTGGARGAPTLARRGKELLALFQFNYSNRGPRGSQSGWVLGRTLCVLDEETGRELWKRDFLQYQQFIQVWPDQGLLTVHGRGLAVFDLDTRSWRWTLPQGDRGSVAVWVHGDALYLGSASGELCRLRLADGSLVWKRKWPGGPYGGATLRAAGSRLLFQPVGGTIVALALADDSVVWEKQQRDPDAQSTVIDGDQIYLASRSLQVVQAISVVDGKVLWETRLRHLDQASECNVSPKALWFGRPGNLVCLDRATGKVVGLDQGADLPGGFTMFMDGETMYSSDRHVHSSAEGLGFGRPPQFSAARLVVGPDAAPPPLPRDEDPLAEVSLLEDACYGPVARPGEDWLTLAAAFERAGRLAGGAEALRRGLVLTRAETSRVREWMDRIPSEKEQEDAEEPDSDDLTDEEIEALAAEEERREELSEELRGLRQQLAALAEKLETEESFLTGEMPKRPDGTPVSLWELSGLVHDADPELTMKRAILMVRGGYGWDEVPHIVGLAGEVPEPLALEGLGGVILLGVDGTDCTRLWAGSRLWGTTKDTTDLEERLRAHLSRPPGALRGAVLALLDLLGMAIPEEGCEASLRAALASEEPLVRLAAAATLTRRGDPTAKGPILDALGSDDKDQKRLAAWLAGNLRLAEAVEALGPTDLEALAQIGTPEAVEKLLEAAKAPNAGENWALALALSRVPSQESRRALIRMGRIGTLIAVEEAMYGLYWIDRRETHLEALEFARLHARLGVLRGFALPMLVRGLVEAGDIAGAERLQAELEEGEPPTTWALALRARVLAAKGDLDGAREARAQALDGHARMDAIESPSARRLVDAAKLYLEPEVIADRAAARGLLERARVLAPHNPEVLKLLEGLGPR